MQLNGPALDVPVTAVNVLFQIAPPSIVQKCTRNHPCVKETFWGSLHSAQSVHPPSALTTRLLRKSFPRLWNILKRGGNLKYRVVYSFNGRNGCHTATRLQKENKCNTKNVVKN